MPQFVVVATGPNGDNVLVPLLPERPLKGGVEVAGAHVAPGASIKPVIEYQPLPSKQ